MHINIELTLSNLPEYRSEKHADVSDVYMDVQERKHVVDATRRDHQTGVHGAADNTTEWVPGTLVEPIQEVVESMLYHVRSGPVVEPTERKRQNKIVNADRPHT